jgi:hypothetical protein
MPESVRDRPTKGHEYLFLLTKRKRYFYDGDAVRESLQGDGRKRGGYPNHTDPRYGQDVENRIDNPAGRNLRTVWAINPGSYAEAHFATFPPALVEPCIKAGTSERGVCPECGAPWERVSERQQFGKAHSDTKFDDTMQAGPLAKSRQAYRQNGKEGPPNAVTLGWRPTCDCYRTRNARKRQQQDAIEIALAFRKRNLEDIDTERKQLEPDSDYWIGAVTVTAAMAQKVAELSHYAWSVRVSTSDAPTIPATVLDPFFGAGTTGVVADRLGRHCKGIDLNGDYCAWAAIAKGST